MMAAAGGMVILASKASALQAPGSCKNTALHWKQYLVLRPSGGVLGLAWVLGITEGVPQVTLELSLGG